MNGVAAVLGQRNWTYGTSNTEPIALRGYPKLVAMLDDYEFSGGQMDEYKAIKCLELAKSILENNGGQINDEMITEMAINLMPLPIMNIERIYKTLEQGKKPADIKKGLNRFQILKKD